MSNLIQFVANYDDLSTDKGFQFKFHCVMPLASSATPMMTGM